MADKNTSTGVDSDKNGDARGQKRSSNSDKPSTEGPSPDKKTKMTFSMGPKIAMNLSSKKTEPVKISLGLGVQKPKTPTAEPIKVKPKLSSVFNPDSSDEDEEMPPEAKMRMKNIGRETPTAAGPNSYGKGKLGFTDSRALAKKLLEEGGTAPPPRKQ